MIRNRLLLAAALALATVAPGAVASDNDIDKVNGSITAEAGQSYGDLSTVNGSIRIGTGAHVNEAETVNGAIHVGDLAQIADGLTTVNGSIKLGRQVGVGDDLVTVNGGVFVDHGGRVEGDIVTVNGSIGLVQAELGGDIETVNGDITVGIGSYVHGGITVEKPNNSWWPISFGVRKPSRIVIAQNAQVDGELRFEREVELYVHDSAEIGPVSGAEVVRYAGTEAPGG